MLVESMPRAYRIKVGLFYYFTDAAIIFWLTIYFYTISKNWLYLQYFQIGVNIIGLFACYYYVQESPRFYIENG
jgi:hypothetical protein